MISETRLRNLSGDSCPREEHHLGTEAKSEDSQTLAHVIEHNRAKLLRIALRITRHREDAEDAVQEGSLRAHRNLAQFQGNSALNTWLTRIVVNEALSCLRKRRAGHLSLDAPIETEDGPVFLDPLETRLTPELQYVETEATSRLHKLVSKLPPAFRSIIVLRHFDELSMEEAANAVGISVTAAKSRVLRARRQLRENLEYELRAN